MTILFIYVYSFGGDKLRVLKLGAGNVKQPPTKTVGGCSKKDLLKG